MRILLTLTIFISVHFALNAQLTPIISETTDEIEVSEGHIEILNKEQAILTVKRRVTILNAESEANLFHVGYDPDNKIMSIDADIYDLEGNSIRKVKKSEIRDVLAIGGGSIYTESRVRYIELNYPTYPYVVEFNYKQKISGIYFAAFPNWYFQDSHSTEVKKSSFKVTIPDNLGFQYKMYNLALTPEIEQGKNKKTYTWTANNLSSFADEENAPALHHLLPVLRLTPKDFKIDNHSGSMASWDAYGAFMHNLWKDRGEIPVSLSNKIEELTESAQNDKEKIRLLYQYMQKNMRYVSVQLGIGGWQPFSARYVDEHGYGDCKALSNYMKAMLNDIGIESYPVIIAAGDERPYEVEDDFVDPAFNHAILYVPDHDMWLECTSSFAPAGYLGDFCNDRKVLLVTPEGGQLARTPKLSTEENIYQEITTISIGDDGSAQIDYKGDFAGVPHEDWRVILNYYTQEEIENIVRSNGKLPNVQFDSLLVKDDPINPVSTLNYSAKANRYASKAGKRLFVPLNLICPQQNIPDAVEKREHPIITSYGYTKNATITFAIPEGYKIESLPKNVSEEGPVGQFSIVYSSTDKEVILERQLLIFEREHPAEDYDAIRSFYLDVVKHDGAKMVLVME